MKAKIKERLKVLFPGVNFSQKRLDAIADKVAAKITTEDEIDARLNDFNDMMDFASVAKEDDRVRTLEAKLAKPAPPKEEPTPKDDLTKPNEGIPDDTPAWAKTLIESHKALAQDVTSLKAKDLQKNMLTKVKEKLKDVPETYYKGRALPEDDEALDEWVTGVTADYTQFKQDLVDQGLMQASGAPAGAAGGNVTKTAVEAGIKDWAAKAQAAAQPNVAPAAK